MTQDKVVVWQFNLGGPSGLRGAPWVLGVSWLLAGAAWLCSTCRSIHPQASQYLLAAGAEAHESKRKCKRPLQLRFGTGAPLRRLPFLWQSRSQAWSRFGTWRGIDPASSARTAMGSKELGGTVYHRLEAYTTQRPPFRKKDPKL